MLKTHDPMTQMIKILSIPPGSRLGLGRGGILILAFNPLQLLIRMLLVFFEIRGRGDQQPERAPPPCDSLPPPPPPPPPPGTAHFLLQFQNYGLLAPYGDGSGRYSGSRRSRDSGSTTRSALAAAGIPGAVIMPVDLFHDQKPGSGPATHFSRTTALFHRCDCCCCCCCCWGRRPLRAAAMAVARQRTAAAAAIQVPLPHTAGLATRRKSCTCSYAWSRSCRKVGYPRRSHA